MLFSEKIRSLRKERGETQTQVAEAAKITLRQYQRLEAGEQKPGYDVFIAIAEHFDVSLDDLIGRSSQRKQRKGRVLSLSAEKPGNDPQSKEAKALPSHSVYSDVMLGSCRVHTGVIHRVGDRMSFSENLAALRKEKKLSQKAVADANGIALRAYQRYEYGEREPQLSTLVTLAKFYGITLDELVFGKG